MLRSLLNGLFKPRPQADETPDRAAGGADVGEPLYRAKMIAADAVYDRATLLRQNVYLLRLSFLLGLGFLGAIAVIGIMISAPKDRTYFATEPDGSLIPMVPLSRPIMDDSALGDWTVRAVTKAFTLSWSNYQDDTAAALPAFTPEGQDTYLSSLQADGVLKLITSEDENLRSVATGAPRIIQRGTDASGRVFWVLQFPMVWTYSAGATSQQGSASQSVIVRVVVVRAPQAGSPSGLAINQIIVSGSSQ